MSNKINCPFHKEILGKHDSTASCHIYPETDTYYCFGCGATGKIKDLPGEHKLSLLETVKKPKEDLERSFKRIHNLPVRKVRGLDLHTDSLGYYIIWPEDKYYKKRLYKPGVGGKYLSPTGHKKPLFYASRNNTDRLIIVEGEINALSIAEVVKDWSICSPGSAADFYSTNTKKYMKEFEKYQEILVIADDDPAGDEAARKLLKLLREVCFCVRGQLMSIDANQILVAEGEEVLYNVLKV